MAASYLARSRNYVIVLLSFLAAAVWWLAWMSSPTGRSNETVVVVLPMGANAGDVADRLHEKGLIRSRRVFLFTVRLAGASDKLKPGTYRFSRGLSLPQIARMIERGEVAGVWVTIPEGFTMAQIAERLAARGLVSEEEFLKAAHEGTLYPDLATGKDGSLEGYLFPDTYLVPISVDARTIVQEMVQNFRRRVIQGCIGKTGKDPSSIDARWLRRIVIIASLVEREAKVPEDRAMIAAVIYNRLRRGMKLEIDATVQYARGVHKARLLYRDLEVQSPYNTYLYPGLPPGPIANPGVESIEAALHPAATDALYYVAGKDGKHIFTRTLAEHNAAKRRVRMGN